MNGQNYYNVKPNYFEFPDIGKYELYVLLDFTNVTTLTNAFARMLI